MQHQRKHVNDHKQPSDVLVQIIADKFHQDPDLLAIVANKHLKSEGIILQFTFRRLSNGRIESNIFARDHLNVIMDGIILVNIYNDQISAFINNEDQFCLSLLGVEKN